VTPNSYIEISESAIANNIRFIRDLIGENVVFSSVVKGNAYGHGIETYCPLAYKYGVRHFSVSDAEEAYAVLQAVPQQDITVLIMGMIDNEHLEWAIEKDIEFYVFEKNRLKAAIDASKKVGKPARIHIEVETGMNRTGFEQKDFKTVLHILQENTSYVKMVGLCTHLAGAESIANYKRIKDQQKKFKRIIQYLEKTDQMPQQIHMASSAATIRYPKARYNLVRVGIMQYGFFPTEEILVHYLTKQKSIKNPLKRIVSWKTKVMDVKTVKSGNFIGYGTSYFTNKTTHIAIIPVGYSSGFSRSLSNTGKVLIRGKRLDVIGTVNMNMMAVDITDSTEIEKGDDVVLIGNQGEQEITVSSFSDFSQILNYELLTRLPRNITRITTP
jgi:alanine racemase